ncbi:Prolyl 4-Hydroxylase Subunit Alpha-2 [Manis pentadactyla]|nr:Prolyl 4-Hydroxylase Subunit Alpha-2 [Manis pentadactyla]
MALDWLGHMAGLISVEKLLAQALKEYICLDEARLSRMKSWAEKRDALKLLIPDDMEDLGKLVDVYKVLKYLNKDWSSEESYVLQDPSTDSSHEQAQLKLPYFVQLLEEERAGKLGNGPSETKKET